MLNDILANARFVDLTQTLGPETVLWSDSDRFSARVEARHETDGMYFRSLQMPEHSGTHVDAPIHFGPGQAALDQIDISRLVAPAYVADIRHIASADPDLVFREAHLNDFEARYGKVEEGGVFLLCTGWDKHRHDPHRYLRSMRFPGFGADAAEALVDRGVFGIGIDTLSVDAGCDDSFPVHNATQPNGVWHLEGLINLDLLPATGAWLVAAPLLLEDGSGSPARVFAIVPG